MADYPIGLANVFGLELPTPGPTLDRAVFDLTGDLTSVPDLIGWRIDVEVAASAGGQTLYAHIAYDHEFEGFAAFEETIPVSGPGSYSATFGEPYFDTNGNYAGIYDLLDRVVNTAATGYIEVADGPAEVTLSSFSVVFFAADVGDGPPRKTRMFPIHT